MRRYLPLCLLGVLFAHSWGCGESPNRPSVVSEIPIDPPKRNARFIQAPWDISLFFNIPGGAVVADATTAATSGNAAPGDNLTGTYSNTNGFGGTISGVLTGSLESGSFDGTLTTVMTTGCVAERRYSGPITRAALNWSPGNHVNDCGGTSPLTIAVQASAAPTTQPPCSYTASVTATSFPAAGGTGTATVTADTGCTWFANATASFVTASAGQGSGNGSVQFTVAANTSTTARTATLVVAGQSFTITQAGAPAPVCTYVLNGTGRTFDAAGALGGVDMRAPAGCAWTAQSDAPWLTVTGGAAGNGNGTISFAVAANPDPVQRVGSITAAGNVFTVTQTGAACSYTVTSISATEFPHQGGTATATVATHAACGWGSLSNVPWITTTGGGTGGGILTITVAANPDPVARSGVLNIAGRPFTIAQAAAPCTYTLTPSSPTIPTAGGPATIAVATHSTCAWAATVDPTTPWVTITGGRSGTGNGTISLNFTANTTAQPRPGIVTVAGQTVTFTQAATTAGTLAGVITNSFNGQPIPAASVMIIPVNSTSGPSTLTNDAGAYTIPNLTPGAYNVLVQKLGFDDGRGPVGIAAAQTTTFNAALAPRPVNLNITWAPNPTSVNPADPGCGQTDRYCWRSTVTVQETSGTAARVTSWVVNFYNPDGSLASSETRTEADFATQFVNPVPGGTSVARARQVTSTSPSGGGLDYVLSGVDPFGRSFSFRSARLIENPFIVIGVLPAPPSGPPQRGEGPAGRRGR